MFAKIFESIYDGTLADHWQGLVTFQQLLILSDQTGVVDMTPGAIARKTGIPREIIDAGLAFLAQPDPQSRSSALEGRRIALLDPSRTWGWFIVNHAEYRRKISAEEKRAKDREGIAVRRAALAAQQCATPRDTSRQGATCREVSQQVVNVAHTDTELDTEAEEAKAHALPEITEQPNSDAPPIDPAVRACQLMVEAGIPPHRINHAHAGLHDGIAEGVTPEMFAAAVPSALSAKAANPFPFAIVIARGEHAKRGSDPPPRAGPPSAKPNAITQNFEELEY